MRHARAHHSRAHYTEAADLRLRRCDRSADELVGLSLVHEHRPHQVARHRACEQPAELLRLDPKAGVDRHLCAFVNGGEDRKRRWVVPHRGTRDQRRAGREGLRRRRRAHPGAARHAKPLAIPRLDCFRRTQQPAACAIDDLRGGRGLVHHPLTERVGGPDLLAFGDQTQRLRDTDQPRQPLRATGAGEQADLHLREADAGLRLVGKNPVVTGERQLEAGAECHAVDRRRERFTAGLEPPEDPVQVRTELRRLRRRDAALEHRRHVLDIRAGHEARLPGGDDHTAHGRIRGQLVDAGFELAQETRGHDVHRAIDDIDQEHRNAVAVDGLADVLCHVPVCLAMPARHTRSMIVVVPIPAPTHRVTSAVARLRRSSSSSTVPRIIAPVAPSG